MKKLFLTALCATAFASSLYCAESELPRTAFASSLYCAESELPRWVIIQRELRIKQHPYNNLVNEAAASLARNDTATFTTQIAQAKILYQELQSLKKKSSDLTPKDAIITADLAIFPFPLDETGKMTPQFELDVESYKRHDESKLK